MKNNAPTKILFEETQRFTQWWVWLLLIVPLVWSVAVFFVKTFQSENFSNSDIWGIVIVLLLFISIICLHFSIKLQIAITSKGVEVRFFPFKKSKFFAWEEFDKVYVREYKPLVEYGGWGLRGVEKNRAYNVSGNWGLQLIMKNGNKLLIGTKDPAEMESVLRKLAHENISCLV